MSSLIVASSVTSSTRSGFRSPAGCGGGVAAIASRRSSSTGLTGVIWKLWTDAGAALCATADNDSTTATMITRSFRRRVPTLSMLLKISLLLWIFSIFTVAAKAQDFVYSVRNSLDRGALPEAEAKLKQYRDLRGITPEYLEA